MRKIALVVVFLILLTTSIGYSSVVTEVKAEKDSSMKVYVDERLTDLDIILYNDDKYLSVDDIANIFGIRIGWDYGIKELRLSKDDTEQRYLHSSLREAEEIIESKNGIIKELELEVKRLREGLLEVDEWKYYEVQGIDLGRGISFNRFGSDYDRSQHAYKEKLQHFSGNRFNVERLRKVLIELNRDFYKNTGKAFTDYLPVEVELFDSFRLDYGEEGKDVVALYWPGSKKISMFNSNYYRNYSHAYEDVLLHELGHYIDYEVMGSNARNKYQVWRGIENFKTEYYSEEWDSLDEMKVNTLEIFAEDFAIAFTEKKNRDHLKSRFNELYDVEALTDKQIEEFRELIFESFKGL